MRIGKELEIGTVNFLQIWQLFEERNVKMGALDRKVLKELRSGGLGVEDGRLVAPKRQVTRGHQRIASIVS